MKKAKKTILTKQHFEELEFLKKFVKMLIDFPSEGLKYIKSEGSYIYFERMDNGEQVGLFFIDKRRLKIYSEILVEDQIYFNE